MKDVWNRGPGAAFWGHVTEKVKFKIYQLNIDLEITPGASGFTVTVNK